MSLDPRTGPLTTPGGDWGSDTAPAGALAGAHSWWVPSMVAPCQALLPARRSLLNSSAATAGAAPVSGSVSSFLLFICICVVLAHVKLGACVEDACGALETVGLPSLPGQCIWWRRQVTGTLRRAFALLRCRPGGHVSRMRLPSSSVLAKESGCGFA